MNHPFAIGIAAFAWLVTTGQANAQPIICGEHDVLVESFEETYGEVVRARAVTARGSLLEVLATLDGSTWTVIITSPDGWACTTALGRDWTEVEPAEGDPA